MHPEECLHNLITSQSLLVLWHDERKPSVILHLKNVKCMYAVVLSTFVHVAVLQVNLLHCVNCCSAALML